jgi:branched-chain amino acid transport system ATP-binding protein
MSALELTDVTAGYGGIAVIRNVSLTVDAGEIVALLGPNGAGKTTTLFAIAGFLRPTAGDIHVLGSSVIGASPHVIARRGMALLPEDRGIFFQLTVAENLRLHSHSGSDVSLDRILEYFPALKPLLRRKAGLLSGGEQQMLALGSKLIANPRVLMVDEMSLGLAPIIFGRLLPILRDIATDAGVAVLLVEQHVHAALRTADRAYVLAHGEIVLHGNAAELNSNRAVLEASYLGQKSLTEAEE